MEALCFKLQDALVQSQGLVVVHSNIPEEIQVWEECSYHEASIIVAPMLPSKGNVLGGIYSISELNKFLETVSRLRSGYADYRAFGTNDKGNIYPGRLVYKENIGSIDANGQFKLCVSRITLPDGMDEESAQDPGDSELDTDTVVGAIESETTIYLYPDLLLASKAVWWGAPIDYRAKDFPRYQQRVRRAVRCVRYNLR